MNRSGRGSRCGGHVSAAVLIWLVLLSAAAAQSAAAVPEKQQVLWQKLEASIAEVDHGLDGAMGVAILDLTDGHKYLLHANDVFAQASSIKICVLAELYRQAQQGKLKLTDLYTVNASDLVPDSDIMGGLTPGITRITLHDLATMMVAVSDNSATNVLIDRVGMQNVNSFLDSLGLAHTRLRRKMMDVKAAAEGRENISTPAEMMSLLEAIYRGKVLNKEMTDGFFKMLSTHKDSWIPRLLPDDLKIANKPGALEGVRNDSGVVFVEKRPYVLCVMTSYLHRERDGEEAISAISLAAWRMFDRLARASEYGRVVSPGTSSH
jgi:beta-lactamase class A